MFTKKVETSNYQIEVGIIKAQRIKTNLNMINTKVMAIIKFDNN